MECKDCFYFIFPLRFDLIFDPKEGIQQSDKTKYLGWCEKKLDFLYKDEHHCCWKGKTK